MRQQTPRDVFRTQVRDWANRLDVPVRTLTIRPMTNKWASCSSAGSFTFNSELLDFEEELREYVIVHELMHFAVPNHGKLWKSLMRAHVGDYEELEVRLKQRAADSG